MMMRFLKKLFNKEEEIIDDEPFSNECSILLYMKEDNVRVAVEWSDDLDLKHLGAFVGSIATGEIMPLIINDIVETLKRNQQEDDIQIISDVIKYKINQHRESQLKQFGEDEPVIQPIEAIRRQLTMYQPQGQG
jgi:hypothetical protein